MVNEKFVIENKKPFEIVQEIENYQIKKSPLSPAARGKIVNKSGSNFLSDNKEGYGPCHSCGNSGLTFKLEIILRKWDGGKAGTVYSTDHAEKAAREIRNATGHWAGNLQTGPFSQSKREILANKIMNQVDIHKNGGSVDKTVTSDNDGGSDCSTM